MRVVYIAGPFRADTHWGTVQNVRAAEEAALNVWLMGCAALCPHLNTANFQGAAPDFLWLDGDLGLLRRCDAVLVVGDYESSSGTIGEIDEAGRLGMPIFFEPKELYAWIRGLES